MAPSNGRFKEDLENQLREIDERSAECYAELEAVMDQMKKVAKEISDTNSKVPLKVCGNGKLQGSIEETKASLRRRRSDTTGVHSLKDLAKVHG